MMLIDDLTRSQVFVASGNEQRPSIQHRQEVINIIMRTYRTMYTCIQIIANDITGDNYVALL